MTVCFLVDRFLPRQGNGASLYAFGATGELTKRGHEVHVRHLQGLGVGHLDGARSRGMPVPYHAFDAWALCPRGTLLRTRGDIREGPRELEDGAGDRLLPRGAVAAVAAERERLPVEVRVLRSRNRVPGRSLPNLVAENLVALLGRSA